MQTVPAGLVVVRLSHPVGACCWDCRVKMTFLEVFSPSWWDSKGPGKGLFCVGQYFTGLLIWDTLLTYLLHSVQEPNLDRRGKSPRLLGMFHRIWVRRVVPKVPESSGEMVGEFGEYLRPASGSYPVILWFTRNIQSSFCPRFTAPQSIGNSCVGVINIALVMLMR